MRLQSKFRKVFGVLSLAALSAAAVFALGTNVSASETPAKPEKARWTITIPGKSGSLCNSPTYVAYEKGFFAEEGIDATLITADFESKKIGLNNGAISTVNGDFQYFPAIEGGVNMTVVFGLHEGCIKLNVLPDSEIKGVKDLAGKTIAVDEIGGTPHQVALLWLAQNGVNPNQVKFLPFNDGNLELQALYNKQVDVAALWDPLSTTSVKDGSTRTILDISKDEPFAGHYCCFLYASTKLLSEQPELIAAELRAYRKAQDWIHHNPEEAVKLVTEKQYVSIADHDLAVELIKSYHYPTLADYQSGKVDVGADVAYFSKALYNVGYLQTAPEEYIKKAYTAVDLSR